MSVARAVFDAVDYDRDNPLLAVERPETERRLPELAGRDVLDIGGGRGHYAHLCRERGARSVVALDVCASLLKAGSTPAVVADAAALPVRDGSCDVAIAALVLSYVDCRRALAEVARILRPGGVLIVSELHAEGVARGGWRRTFPAIGGATVTLEAPALAPAVLASEIERAGLEVVRLEETPVDQRLRPHFERAGRRDFERLAGLPLLLHVVARRGLDG